MHRIRANGRLDGVSHDFNDVGMAHWYQEQSVWNRLQMKLFSMQALYN